MISSRPAVHPVEASPPVAPEDPTVNPMRVRMKDMQGMPGTSGGLVLRLSQFAFAVVGLGVMTTTSDFATVSAFRYLVAAVSLQCLWSFLLAFIDIYALLVKRCLRNPRIVCFFTIGDGVISTLTFAAACASSGITVLISNDLDQCTVNHCLSFETATAMSFLTWVSVFPCFLINFWSLASR